MYLHILFLCHSGDRVKLACVNWSGGQLKAYVVNGLDVQPLKSIAQTIADLGFNCVRLVNSLDLIYLNPVRHFLIFYNITVSEIYLCHFNV